MFGRVEWSWMLVEVGEFPGLLCVRCALPVATICVCSCVTIFLVFSWGFFVVSLDHGDHKRRLNERIRSDVKSTVSAVTCARLQTAVTRSDPTDSPPPSHRTTSPLMGARVASLLKTSSSILWTWIPA